MIDAEGVISPAPASKSPLRLRELPVSSRYFWKADLTSHIAQRILDKTHDGTNHRSLSPHEIDAMALNEIAVAYGKGFFFFLSHRVGWNKQVSTPKSRGPDVDGLDSAVPSLAFMRYEWSDSSKACYLRSSHRSRYVACDFQLNPPPPQTPLYCFQLASGPRYPLYTTEHSSFIILRADPLYFGSAVDVGAAVGLPARKRKGLDPQKRLGQPQGVWDKASTNPGLEQFRVSSLEELYTAIDESCHPAAALASMTSRQLCQILPRPLRPEVGLALGDDDIPVQSRFGGRLRRRMSDSGPNTFDLE